MERIIQKLFLKLITGENGITLRKRAPCADDLREKLGDIKQLGLYLHIPFCRQICPYCPYNKELLNETTVGCYVWAVRKEIDFYASLLAGRQITSLYIGGGTPTTMLGRGLAEILRHMQAVFHIQGPVHLESHPNDLSAGNLDAILSLGIRHLSIGIEALQDRHLRFLRRPYTVEKAKEVLQRSVGRGFECVNADVMFALPDQTGKEIEETGRALVELGVDQVAAYLNDVFYINTFRVSEYIDAWKKDQPAIALWLDLSERMQRAGWLYWRVYETAFRKADYMDRFGNDFNESYSGWLKLMAMLGFLKDDGERIVLSDRGAFWMHAFEDMFSIHYINRLWGVSTRDPWPEQVLL